MNTVVPYRAVEHVSHLDSMCCGGGSDISVVVYVAVLNGISAAVVKIDSVTESFYLQIRYNYIIVSFIVNSRAITPSTNSRYNTIQCMPIPIYHDIISSHDQTVS